VAGEVETRKGGQTPVTWRRVVVGVIGLFVVRGRRSSDGNR
jgi:hypothetical protein